MKKLLYLLGMCLTAVAPARDLFAPAPRTGVPLATPTSLRKEARARAVTPALGLILELRVNRTNDLRLNLFEDASFGLIVEEREDRSGGGCSISGRLREEPSGTFNLVAHEGIVVGVVRLPARRQLFRVSYTPDGLHTVAEVIEDRLGECAAQGAPAAAIQPGAIALAAPPAGDSIQCGDDSANDITVMVAYTAITRAAAGGVAAMQAECQLAVDTANACYGSSGINARLRLIRTEEVSYNEGGTLSDHLDRLTAPADGIMDDLHTLRNDIGADMVSLIVEDDDSTTGTPLGGLAHIMRSLSSGFADYAFSIVNRDNASLNFTLAHELGHNMGCAHDRANAAGGLYSYSYGWRFTGTDRVLYRTVMAYSPGTRVGHFSNPNIDFSGTPTGVAIGQPDEAFNAQTINNSAFTVANWRRSVVWVDFNYRGANPNGCFSSPYNVLALGVTAVPIGGTINIKTSSRNEPITISKAMLLQAYGGPVTIGQ